MCPKHYPLFYPNVHPSTVASGIKQQLLFVSFTNNDYVTYYIYSGVISLAFCKMYVFWIFCINEFNWPHTYWHIDILGLSVLFYFTVYTPWASTRLCLTVCDCNFQYWKKNDAPTILLSQFLFLFEFLTNSFQFKDQLFHL